MPHLSLLLAFALIAGLAGGIAAEAPLALAASLTLSASWTIAVLAYRAGWPRVQLASLAVAVALAGAVLGDHALDRALHTPLRAALERRHGGFALDGIDERRLDEPVAIEGRLREDATVTEAGVTVYVDVARAWVGSEAEAAAGGVVLGVGGAVDAGRVAAWRAGRVIRAPALLRRPSRYLNEGLPDQERAQARRGISLVGAVKSERLVEVVARGRWWEEACAALRSRTRSALAQHVGPYASQSAAIATAVLIGDRGGLDQAVEQRLQEAGTYHVIAISGGNVAILVGLLVAVLAALGLRGRLAIAVTIAAIGAFALVAEGSASVARACLMAAIYLAVRLIDQRTAAASAIGLAGAAILLATPLAVTDVGFWLTFGATAAIVVAASRLDQRRSWRRSIATVLVATCAVEIALMPVSAFVFQRVTLAGLALNFVALPAMALVQLAAMTLVFCDLLGLGAMAGWTAPLVHAGSVALIGTASAVDFAPWLTWRIPSPSRWEMAAYYAALAGALFGPRMGVSLRATRPLACVAAALMLWMVSAPSARVRDGGDGRLRLTMIDVGQGDALLVTFPNNRRLVVDAGGASTRGTFDVGDRVVGPLLRARGILDLDYLAVTHGNPDHLGGAASLVRDFGPREVWWGVPVAGHEPTARLYAEADRARSGWRTLQRGDRLDIGGVVIRWHHPPLPDWERQRTRNDDSMVMELRLGDVSMLLTGDIGSGIEQTLLPTLDLGPLVVLKVAHHGSATSSSPAFVEHVRPAVALVGAGRGNSYGHPVQAVLDRLHAVGTRVFRTDRDGQVDVTTDGRSIQVETFAGSRWVSRASHEVTKPRRE